MNSTIKLRAYTSPYYKKIRLTVEKLASPILSKSLDALDRFRTNTNQKQLNI